MKLNEDEETKNDMCSMIPLMTIFIFRIRLYDIFIHAGGC